MLGVTALVGDRHSRRCVSRGSDRCRYAGTPSPVAPVASSADAAAFRARVTALYDTMQSALKRGDLSTFGTAYAELGRLLGRPAERPPIGKSK